MSVEHRNTGRITAALILIGLGVLFLLGDLNILSFSLLGTLWPFFIIVPGLVFLYVALTGSPDSASLAIPGAIVTGTGMILLYQSATGHWESWAYIWTLYPVFLGLGLMYMGRRTGNTGSYRTGLTLTRIGVLAFLVFGAFFEVFIFSSLGLGRYALPLILIIWGAWMLMRGARGGSPGDKPKRGDEPLFTGATVTGQRGTYSATERLRAEIDAALAEDDEPDDGDDV